MGLKKYHQKRNFEKTPEPRGSVKKMNHKKELRFVIQKHAASHLHYDFRLELNGVLLSWAIPKGPSLDPKIKRLAMHVEDHPLAYGTFEGIIPKGQYGGGTVMLWDEGTWQSEDENPVKAYRAGNMTFVLYGKKLRGGFKLIHTKIAKNSWLLIKLNDRYAKLLDDYDVTTAKPNSIKSKKNLDEIAESYQAIWGETGEEKPTRKKRITSVSQAAMSHTKHNEKSTQVKKVPHDVRNDKPRPVQFNLKPSPFPKTVFPELATLVDEAPPGDDWLHEIKFDGYRLLAVKYRGKTAIFTRRHHDWTHYFQKIAHAINQLPIDNMIVDGEVVVLNEEHRSDFQLLQNSIQENKESPFIYYVFDLIYYDRFNMTHLPLIERKLLLKEIIPENDEHLRYSDHIIGNGKKILKNACKMKLEGIVSKNIHSEYVEKRSTDWRKVKCMQRQEFIIGGFTKPQGARKHFGALLLGTYNDQQKLIYHGNVGTGFTDTSLETIYAQLKKNISNTMPFQTKPPGSSKTTWLKPVLVAEVEFSEWTKDNALRHPSFKGLRTDKKQKLIIKEVPKHLNNKNTEFQNKMNSIKISNPKKILYPESNITKENLVAYYDHIADWILPYIAKRPLTLVRCPDNYKKCFFQKHIQQTTKNVFNTIEIKEKEKSGLYIYIENKTGLLALPQMGVLEIHIWNCSIKKIECPDMLVFDLDPAPNVTWKKVVTAAFKLKIVLEEVQLKSYVKTTGGKGLHVVVPIKPTHHWDTVKKFAEIVAHYLVLQNPNAYVDNMSKAKRAGKIFIDFYRNQKGATAIAPYSTRARLHAPIAVPLAWDELTNSYRDTFYTLKTLPKRLNELKENPWEDFFTVKQSLKLKK